MLARTADTKRVGYFMHENPVSIDLDASIADAIDLFERLKLSHLPVLKNQELVGIISKEDLFQILYKLSRKTPGKRFNKVYLKTEKVSAIMSRDIVTLRESDHRDFAVELLLQGRFHSVPVVDDERTLVGIVTPYDFLKGYYEILLKLSDV